MAKKSIKKKKGPKGKQARAKAKLDRQWGEIAADTNGSSHRRGGSRLVKEKRSSSTRVVSTTRDDNDPDFDTMERTDAFHRNFSGKEEEESSSSAESSADEEMDDDTEQNGYLSRLLGAIQKKQKDDDYSSESDESASSSDDISDGSLEETHMEMMSESFDNTDNDDDDRNTAEQEQEGDADFDPFGERFSNTPPLPDDMMERNKKIIAPLKVMTKIPLVDIDSLLDLQVSRSIFDRMEDRNGDDDDKNEKGIREGNMNWKKLATESFQCNRVHLKRRWNKTTGFYDKKNRKRLLFSPIQNVLYPFVVRYTDILFTSETKKNREYISSVFILHLLNHVMTSRGRIQRHNRRLQQEEEADEEQQQPVLDDDGWKRDQGFTRPTVLVLLPTRGTCHSFVNRMLLMLNANSVEQGERFEAEYGKPANDEEEDVAETKRRKKILEMKGPSWNELFGDDRNDDDDFKIGISLRLNSSKKNIPEKKKMDKGTTSKNGVVDNSDDDTNSRVSMKLYSDFYKSDFILASPLGLKMLTNTTSDPSEEEEGADSSSSGNVDFLSNIEICLVANADVLLMQNWDHVNDVLSLLNRQPKNNNDTDFSRVRNYLLAGDQASHWRQLIVCSGFMDPMIQSTFKRFAQSIGGKFKLRRRTSSEEASIANVMVPNIRQVFQRVPTRSIVTQGEDMLKYFSEKIFTPILHQKQKHTLVYIPSYFDFVAVRNFLLRKEFEFVSVTEYSRITETSRGRARFLQGRKPLMLYTGRAHFFLRHMIKGIRHLIFFGLPEHVEFYSGLVNTIHEGLEDEKNSNRTMDNWTSSSSDSGSCLALFTKYHAHALERIVGSTQCNHMVKSEKSAFVFVS